MAVAGLDYAWDRPNPHTLYTLGYRFACRYLSYDTKGKNLTKAEAAALRSAGLGVCLNWEYGKYDALEGRAKGIEVGRAALSQARACGAPDDIPIYLSIDFDATTGQFPAIVQYFEGFGTQVGTNRTGVYGGIRTCDYLYRHGLAPWLWQTYAWSGSEIHSAAHVYQYSNGHTIAGADADLDRALKPNFGAWGAIGVGSIGAVIAAAQPPLESGWDYSAEIGGTADQIAGLAFTTQNYTTLVNQLRNL